MVDFSTTPIPLSHTPFALALAPDGRKLCVTGSDDTVFVIDTLTHKVTSTIACPGPGDLVFHPDGGQLFVTHADAGAVSVVDITTQSVTRTIEVAAGEGFLTMTPDGRRVYVSNQDKGKVSVIDTGLAKSIRDIATGTEPARVVVSPDGLRVYVTDTGANTVIVIDTGTDTVIGSPIPVGWIPFGMAVTPDSRRVFVASLLGNQVAVIDATTRSVTANIAVEGFPQDLQISPDGRRLFLTHRDMDRITVVGTADLRVLRTLPTAGAPRMMALTADGHCGYASDFEGSAVLPFLTESLSASAGVRPESVSAPDSRRVYVANSGSDAVSVIGPDDWRVPAGQEPNAVAVTPDGRLAFVANGKSNALTVFDADTDEVLDDITLANPAVTLSMSRDGRFLFAAGQNRLTGIDVSSQEKFMETNAWEGSILSIAAAPDGRHVYVADEDADTVFLFALADPVNPGTPVPVGSQPNAVAVTPDGDVYVANRASDDVTVIDGSTLTVVATLPVGVSPAALTVSADGRRVYVANQNDTAPALDGQRGHGGCGTVSVIDTATRSVSGDPIPAGRQPIGLAPAAQGDRLYVAAFLSAAMLVIDTATRTVIDRTPVGLYPTAVALTPDGRRAFVTNSGDGDVSDVDTHTTRIPVGKRPTGMAAADGLLYVANSGAGTVSVIDIETNAPTDNAISVGGQPRTLAIAPDGSRLYVTDSGTGSVHVVDTATRAVLGTPVLTGSTPLGAAVSPDGTRLYVTDSDAATITVIDTGTRTVIGTPAGVGVAPLEVVVAPGGSRLFVADTGADKLLVVDTATLVVTTAVELPGAPHGLALSAEGRTLVVTIPAAQSLAVIDTATLKTVGAPLPVGNAPHGVTFAPGGLRVYVANTASNTVSLVDL
ncbi:beta-propeller fold lactonase family protein [Streptomyces sp. NRRL S-337]|uniref:YVTN family beta-propeller repeat protein n=1 Tax=Streptomyces sp. NRRL S-337 TaxID=1463900 RepID=UPI00068AA4DF|nr:beta-propeller fold lactonase family protein [Streptomyces sp. NRRL S-337]